MKPGELWVTKGGTNITRFRIAAVIDGNVSVHIIDSLNNWSVQPTFPQEYIRMYYYRPEGEIVTTMLNLYESI